MMNEIIVIAVFVFWYGMSLYISEILGRKSKIGVELLFFISMILSPLLALLMVKAIKYKYPVSE
jgi:hypothetical protein